ncbi:HK97-gp10 family putative phage morphogenesis protein [Natrinema soli]|uniref:HK97-gp10 family putative phage morphogenesis protein n=1 Tax=Natrinema soli TaxID=1930624 RepID=A0ABD5SLW4_9EURY|nr:HK97-gp10 family putative phage morphogenesis protein [Natrinema soli]
MTKQNDFSIDWERGRSPAALMAKLEGFEAVFFEKELPRAAEDIALRLERVAKELAPVGETGNLRAGIEGLSEKIAAHTVKAIVKDDVEYAPFQEFGTAIMDAQPFIRPAIEKNRKWIKERVKEAFNTAADIVS